MIEYGGKIMISFGFNIGQKMVQNEGIVMIDAETGDIENRLMPTIQPRQDHIFHYLHSKLALLGFGENFERMFNDLYIVDIEEFIIYAQVKSPGLLKISCLSVLDYSCNSDKNSDNVIIFGGTTQDQSDNQVGAYIVFSKEFMQVKKVK